ncbi:MAG: serine hydrolase, partial [Verrucomicrobiales bacterium]|nr:serine hydrolase [Verrucomicrobiales bacterium]
MARRLRAAGLLACGFILTGCDDPQREAELRWREEEVNAKEVDVVRREREVQKQLQAMESLKIELTAGQARVKQQQKELDAEVAKMRAARIAFETKELRGPAPKISAERAIVIDAETGQVLFEKEADKEGPIASTQKLLTALLVVEAGSLDSVVTVEKSDTECAPVRLGIQPGEQYTRRKLLTALLVKSSNDIAQALARDVAGSVEAFVQRMNTKAAELGLENSHFVNPHGLPDETPQFSTARNLSVIAALVDRVPDIREMVKTRVFQFEREGKSTLTLENTNRVLRTCGYCDGMKTGYTDASGYCLVASGEKDGRRRIVVVLND